MCGILGLFIIENTQIHNKTIKKLVNQLYKLSEVRGRDATGIAIIQECGIDVYKKEIPASLFLKDKKFNEIFNDSLYSTNRKRSPYWGFVGHCRLSTNGDLQNNNCNQPIVTDMSILAHNGIIVNDNEIEQKNPNLNRKTTSDSEIIAKMIDDQIVCGNPSIDPFKFVFSSIDGESSIAYYIKNAARLFLGTNTGSIYYMIGNGIFIFASERNILENIKQRNLNLLDGVKIIRLSPNSGLFVQLHNLEIINSNISDNKLLNHQIRELLTSDQKINDHSTYHSLVSFESINTKNRSLICDFIESNYPKEISNKRCSKCILPDTFPFIEFDDRGVCNFCRTHSSKNIIGEKRLIETIEKFKTDNPDHNCIVGFSGGRDSSFVLHYAKQTLKLNPVTYTYDWGMVTDLARRNCSRLSSRLQTEHIIKSANIASKRENVRINLEAWLKRPDLGMIPLLMAGDKQFYYHAHKLMQETGIKLILSGANPYEKTHFKIGFCGIAPDDTGNKGLLSGIKLVNKIALLFYYVKQFIRNPAYINKSIFDTMHAYYSTYILKDLYLNIFNYIPWDEDEIINALTKEYSWETSPDTISTWRIGDGTASFYNYIYYCVAGFSEIDTFRSNQIRDGIITREQALALSKDENRPRIDSMIWYADTIGFDLLNALSVIHNIPEIVRR